MFTSDNLLSNEQVFARLLPDLLAKTKPGGVYLGVGPEQNFTYMAAMKPRMAFITDIRRGNLHLQLMYKALFELSADRAEFVSRLFTKPRPAGLSASTSVTDLMNAYWEAFTADEAKFAANLKAVNDHLTRTHRIPLSGEESRRHRQGLPRFLLVRPDDYLVGFNRAEATCCWHQSARDLLGSRHTDRSSR
jgi:hypothetical protein